MCLFIVYVIIGLVLVLKYAGFSYLDECDIFTKIVCIFLMTLSVPIAFVYGIISELIKSLRERFKRTEGM